MAAKICTIEIILPESSRFVAVPNWLCPLDSRICKERNDGYFFTSKREAKLFARLIKNHAKFCDLKFRIEIDDLPF